MLNLEKNDDSSDYLNMTSLLLLHEFESLFMLQWWLERDTVDEIETDDATFLSLFNIAVINIELRLRFLLIQFLLLKY